MSGGLNRKSLGYVIADPAADAIIPIMRNPTGQGVLTITAGHIACSATLAAGTANGREFRLVNLGTTGTTVGGTIAAYVGTGSGGTFALWTPAEPVAFTVDATEGEIGEGEWVGIQYNETGTDSWANASVVLEVAQGIVA